MKTVLIADDEDSLRLLVSTALEDSGLQIVEAADGDEALALARLHHPDLLVLDWMMPGLTGVEVTRVLRSQAEPCATPVILLTAKSQQQDVETALGAGVDRYLSKPFSPLELLRAVEDLLSEQAAAPAARAASGKAGL